MPITFEDISVYVYAKIEQVQIVLHHSHTTILSQVCLGLPVLHCQSLGGPECRHMDCIAYYGFL